MAVVVVLTIDFPQAIAGLINAMRIDITNRLQPHRIDDAECRRKAYA
jgi:hypothetical protein